MIIQVDPDLMTFGQMDCPGYSAGLHPGPWSRRSGHDPMRKSLPLPPAAKSDPQALEMIRVWVAKEGLHTTLRIGSWHDQGMDEADAWGIPFSDVIRHVAEAHEEASGRDRRE